MRDWLKSMRLTCGLSQTDIARRLSITQPYYHGIEHGERQLDMTYTMMEKLAMSLDVTVQAIIEAESAYRKRVDAK